MLHKTVKATATTQDQGTFSALAATYAVDRMGDRIVPGAFAKTIAAWQADDKLMPLHFDHGGAPEDIIGSVDPKSMRETEDGLYVEGQIDLEGSEKGREAWRSMKNNVMSLSFGYLTTKERKAGKVNELLELDLFEVSIVPAPASQGTKLLSLKSAKAKLKQAKGIEDVQTFLDENFPGHKIVSAVEDGGAEEPERVKAAPQDPLVKEAWDLIVPRHTPRPQREPEPQPEPLNSDQVQNEAWALITQRHSAA